MQITNYRRNLGGTLSFDAKFPSMRKPQGFIVYPMTVTSTKLRIQSDSRWAEIDLTTGKVELSANHRHSNSVKLIMDKLRGNAIYFTLDSPIITEIVERVRATAGKLVGATFVKTDNSGAANL